MKRLNVRSDPNGIPLGLFFFSGDLFFIGRIFPKGRKYCARFIDDPSRRCILLWSRYCSTLILILNPADIQHNKIKQAQNAMFYLCCTCKKINAQLISSQAFETGVCTPDGNRTHINRTGICHSIHWTTEAESYSAQSCNIFGVITNFCAFLRGKRTWKLSTRWLPVPKACGKVLRIVFVSNLARCLVSSCCAGAL